jgi:FtsZ-interacting cell division protein ZipA
MPASVSGWEAGTTMDPKMIIIAVIVAIAIIALGYVISRKRRTQELRSRFGPEYDRTVRDHGPDRAESVLVERKERVEKLPIRELGAAERERFVTEWRAVQARFVDDPQASVSAADTLVTQLMEARGYPMSNFEQRAADISVDHPRVVDNYRATHEIALRHRRGDATTEDLRKAIVYYRSLFDELLQTRTADVNRREVA